MSDLSPHYKIIKRRLYTEKGTYLEEKSNAYAFEVLMEATKVQVRKAIEAIFEVKVLKVNTMNVPGKPRRVGASYGMTSAWKKVLVTLKEGLARLRASLFAKRLRASFVEQASGSSVTATSRPRSGSM